MDRFLSPQASILDPLVKELERDLPNQCLYIPASWALEIYKCMSVALTPEPLKDVAEVLSEHFAYIAIINLSSGMQLNPNDRYKLKIKLGPGAYNAISFILTPQAIERLNIYLSKLDLENNIKNINDLNPSPINSVSKL